MNKLTKRSKKNSSLFFLIFLLLPVALFLSFYILFPRVVHCYLIRYSGFKMVQPNIFISQHMPETLYGTILQRSDEAKQRVRAFWGDLQSKPSFIFCSTEEEFESYGKNFGSPAMINLTPFGSYIIVKPDGVNIDVLSHELCHAEFTERLGWQTKKHQIPAWFDEGLALMLDYRYPRPGLGNTYGDYLMEWQSYPLQIRRSISSSSLEHINDFFQNNSRRTHLAYLYSGLQVSAWLDKVGREGLDQLVRDIKAGKDFQETYQYIQSKKLEEF